MFLKFKDDKYHDDVLVIKKNKFYRIENRHPNKTHYSIIGEDSLETYVNPFKCGGQFSDVNEERRK